MESLATPAYLLALENEILSLTQDERRVDRDASMYHAGILVQPNNPFLVEYGPGILQNQMDIKSSLSARMLMFGNLRGFKYHPVLSVKTNYTSMFNRGDLDLVAGDALYFKQMVAYDVEIVTDRLEHAVRMLEDFLALM